MKTKVINALIFLVVSGPLTAGQSANAGESIERSIVEIRAIVQSSQLKDYLDSNGDNPIERIMPASLNQYEVQGQSMCASVTITYPHSHDEAAVQMTPHACDVPSGRGRLSADRDSVQEILALLADRGLQASLDHGRFSAIAINKGFEHDYDVAGGHFENGAFVDDDTTPGGEWAAIVDLKSAHVRWKRIDGPGGGASVGN
jgi:hypothetical protein